MNKALFLDRDGVINEEVNYLHKIEDFVFIEEIFPVCKFYSEHGFILIVITNQAGIAKGIYTETEYEILTRWMLAEFSKKGITIEKVYHCPHHPDYSGECDCRKPKPGLILKAGKEFNINFKKSLLIGDKLSDIEAGLNAGIIHVYHIEEIIQNLRNLPLPE
ncbi:MAG: HAD family hydrolase [Prolixibacteraceae bacterium]|nr:HAD family hydrolase [Prolixibacteraceae bacterium]